MKLPINFIDNSAGRAFQDTPRKKKKPFTLKSEIFFPPRDLKWVKGRIEGNEERARQIKRGDSR